MNKIAILDFGGQYCHLISRRLKDLGMFSEIFSSDVPAKKISGNKAVKGIILSGGARSVYEKNAPKFDKKILFLGIPVLGICYGHQLIAHLMDGKVVSGASGEYGLTDLDIVKPTGILEKLGKTKKVWMNHRDTVIALPRNFSAIARTRHSKIAAFADANKKIFGVQFHPEASHTEGGNQIFKNFAFNICKCGVLRAEPFEALAPGLRSRSYFGGVGKEGKSSFMPVKHSNILPPSLKLRRTGKNVGMSLSSKLIIRNIIQEAKETIGTHKAIVGISGGVDSSVATMLVGKAIGKNLVAVYVDTGLMRHRETEFIKKIFKKANFNLKIVMAGKQFLGALRGVSSPEQKRKIIGKAFTDIFSNVAKKEKATFLVQGTIYSDRIESGITKHSSKIKSHHNVGGLPKNLKLNVYEPLRDLYKDEVREIAKEIKLPAEIVTRQVFPGPGLGIRIVGKITPERVEIVRQASRIVEEELKKTKSWKDIWMCFAVLLSIKSVGIQGDERSYKYPIVLRIVESKDAMTANFLKIPYEVLEKISIRITNEIKEVNRVVYDITNKPPGTMEWE